MNRYREFKNAFVVVTVCWASTSAYAHGPQMQIGIDNDRIVTRGLFPDEAYQSTTQVQRVYEIPLVQRALSDANDGWYAQPNNAYAFTGPGVALLDNHFAASSVLTVAYLDGLRIWNGSSFVDPGTEQVAASPSSSFSPSILTTDSGPFGSLALAAVTATSDEHKTLRWRLLGNGVSPNTLSDDGVYLLGLQLLTNQAGIAASLPYYFLLEKNASSQDVTGALAYVNTNFVPEPATAGLLAVAGLLLARRRGRALRA